MEIGKELYETALIHEKGTVQPPLYISTWITQLLYKLSLSAVPPIEENAPISEAIRYILAHVGEPITLDDLSQRQTSVRTIYRICSRSKPATPPPSTSSTRVWKKHSAC